MSATAPGEPAAELLDLAAARRAALLAAGPPVVRDVRFGGAHVRLELFGEAAVDTFVWPFVPAPEGGAPDLVVTAWDRTAGAPLAIPRGAGREHDAAGRRLVAWEEHWVFGFDLAAGRAFFHVPAARAVPGWSVAHPLLKLLHPWLRTRGRHVLHAGAVGVGARGVLVVGPSGSGKSTLSLAAAHAGLAYLGDDYVALGADDLVAHALYRVAKLAPEHLAQRLPGVAAHALPERADLDKRLLAVEPTAAPLTIVALVVPEVTGAAASRLAPIGAGRALRALAPSTLLQLPGFDADFKIMADVARRLPAFHLPLGPDLAGAVAELARLARGEAA